MMYCRDVTKNMFAFISCDEIRIALTHHEVGKFELLCLVVVFVQLLTYNLIRGHLNQLQPTTHVQKQSAS